MSRDKTDAGRIATVPKGTYDNDTIYELLDVVEYEGSSYVLIADNSQGNLPTDSEFWQLLAARGQEGPEGKEGEKPKKGIDYFTDEEKEEFAEKITEDSKEEIKQVTEQGIADFNANAEEIQTDLDRANKKISELADNMETGTIEGESIDVTDSHKYSGNALKVTGNERQETTNGNQLVDFSNLTTNHAICNFTNDILEIVSLGDSYSQCSELITDKIKKNPGKTLKIDYEKLDISKFTSPRDTITQISIYFNDGTPTSYKQLLLKSGIKFDYVVPSDTSNIERFYISFYSNNSTTPDSGTVRIIKPLVYFDNNSDYEKYTGGQASPNPEFPSEVETVKDMRFKRTGKNILKYSDVEFSAYTSWMGLDGQEKMYDSQYIVQSNAYIDFKAIKKYFFSIIENENAAVIQLVDANGNSRSIYTSAPMQFDNDIRLWLRVRATDTTQPMKIKMMVEEVEENQTAPSEYEPYNGKDYYVPLQEEMLTGDYFDDENEVHTWKKIVLDGTENWVMTSSNSYFYYNNKDFPRAETSGTIYPMYSNYFKSISYNTCHAGTVDYGMALWNQEGRLAIRNNNFNSLSDFKNWLKQKYDEGNPVVIYYKLIEPRKLPLTSEQKAVIKELQGNFELAEGVNHIFSLDDLPPNFELNYLKSNKLSLNKEIQDIKNAILVLGGNIDV